MQARSSLRLGVGVFVLVVGLVLGPAGTLSSTAGLESGLDSASLGASTYRSFDDETTIVLQQGLGGYTGTSDTYLHAIWPNWPPGHAGNDQDRLWLQPGMDNVLIRFDLSRLPPGAQVLTATLSLKSYYAHGGGSLLVQGYQVLRPWVDAEATWNIPRDGDAWAGPGCTGIGTDHAFASCSSQTLSDSDRWYEATYSPSEGWKLKVTDARNNNFTEIASAARVIISENAFVLVVPASEFSVAEPAYRVTAFCHEGDFGLNPGSFWSADVEPPVAEGLAPFSP